MSGHTTERIFRSYFSTLNEELVEFASPLFDKVSKDDGNVIDKPITPAPHQEKTHLIWWALRMCSVTVRLAPPLGLEPRTL